MIKKELEVLAQSKIKEKRLELYKQQNGICPICGKRIKFSKAVLDHQHKLLKSDVLGVNGVGQIRGVLCFQCNSWEGKIFNSYKRYGLHKKGVLIPELLKNLALYLEQEALPFIHPAEVKTKYLSKRNYNLLKKVYKGSKFPEFPKSKRLTKALKVLFEEFNINPYNE